MDCGESSLCGSGELDLDPDIVSEEAGKLYSELQLVVETHGAGVVESLLPILVWVLEGLAGCRAQLREKEEAAEKERREREELLERFQNEKTLRRENQERYLELDDQFEHERRAMGAREQEREKRERELEKKAREQADQLMALEEQKANLSRELNSLRNTHNKLVLTHRDLLEKKKELESDASAFRNQMHSTHPEAVSIQSETGNSRGEEQSQKSRSVSNPTVSEATFELDKNESEAEAQQHHQAFIIDIISSTPELNHLKQSHETSSPVSSETVSSGLNSSLFDELKHTHEDVGEAKDKNAEEEQSMETDADCMEWELRNTDSVFSELSELSREYVENVDQGARVRASSDEFQQIYSHYEELKHTHEIVETARKALISRVEELTNERSALSLELATCRETITRLEGKTKEMEEEIKRLRKELESAQTEDPDNSLPTSLRRFSRSEMARVVMEKNQYKERLFELQEAVRRSQIHRFNRFLGLSKGQLAPATALALTMSPATVPALAPALSSQQLPTRSAQTESSSSPRLRKRELYREIRSHVWGTLGKKQLQGWSVPLAVTSVMLACAVAVPPEISGEHTCSVWAITGPASSSDVTVIDPARSNTILEQFSLPPSSPALCICAVPPTGETPGTVWIGTLDGGVLIHSSSSSRRRCLQSNNLCEGVHSLTYAEGEVIAGLANGTLVFFSHNSGGISSHKMYFGLAQRRCSQSAVALQRRAAFGEQQVRFLCAAGSGVWASCRLDHILRLFDWASGRPLQEVDLSSMVTKALGSAFLSLSPLQITAMSVISGRLWVGTGSGAIFSVPLSLRCRMAPSSAEGAASISQLILSGGEGYINFRIGDDGSDGGSENVLQRSERSHLIIWQNPTPSVPSSAL
ncbi:hypothetical protein DNTS_001103 [Danionella cerebrum]|uniref:RH2 domain-containing protein n=1 Tax=Danionella cerebrum TaxID=2873325 RepID=A0A553Q970_9TELE|nr:hypothetical protein DNTS_001103 [Danionella translucida]